MRTILPTDQAGGMTRIAQLFTVAKKTGYSQRSEVGMNDNGFGRPLSKSTGAHDEDALAGRTAADGHRYVTRPMKPSSW
jgi:hypothetical protein